MFTELSSIASKVRLVTGVGSVKKIKRRLCRFQLSDESLQNYPNFRLNFSSQITVFDTYCQSFCLGSMEQR